MMADLAGPPAEGAATGRLGWLGIVRLGLVQAALGAIVALTTSTLNRVMVVELALPAMVAGALVAWHYAVQLSRVRWGHGSDQGARRTTWIVGGIGVLGMGTTLACDGALLSPGNPWGGGALLFAGFSLIGAGVGAAGTSLLALLAAEVAPARRAAAASITWILMIFGIVLSTAITSQLLDPFSPGRLMAVATGVCAVALAVSWLATLGIERARTTAERARPAVPFREALRDVWSDSAARRFSVFIALSMLAYSMQDLILEPFAGLRFEMTPGQSTGLSSIQHGGVLLGMIGLGLIGTIGRGHSGRGLQLWSVAGCTASALALAGLAMAAQVGPGWPLKANVFALGFANGVFTVAAIGSMMALAGAGGPGREGIRMGLWGAAQALAFGLGGFAGAAGLDVARHVIGADAPAFSMVFAVEAVLFLVAAVAAALVGRTGTIARMPALPNDFTAEVQAR
jgi:MFS transporter, BCD family, chlorophyll transporter